MDQVKMLLEAVRRRLPGAALKDAVVSRPLSVNDQHVLVLSEFSIGFGAGGGSGESPEKQGATGSGGGGGGGARANPIAVLVVEQGKVRLEKIGN